MKPGLYKNEHGMVLLVVLLVVALLVTILVEFAFSTLVDLRLAETYRDTTRAYYLAKGGIQVGRTILQEDKNGYDSLQEDWAQGVENYPVADGTVSIRIEDHGGRLDLNRLVTPEGNIDPLFKDRYTRLLEILDAEDPDSLVDTLIDWIDDDSDNEPSGAENYYYRALSDPYNCKNSALDSLQELNLIKGYSSKLVQALRPHVTTYGTAKINVNTASLEVLQAVAPEMDQSSAEVIIEGRSQKPLSALTELKELPGMETMYGFIYLYLDVKSSRFSIESTSFVNDGRRTIHANIAKENDRILYKRVL